MFIRVTVTHEIAGEMHMCLGLSFSATGAHVSLCYHQTTSCTRIIDCLNDIALTHTSTYLKVYEAEDLFFVTSYYR